MGDLLIWDGNTTLDIPVQKVLDGAKDCKQVLILGLDPDDKMFYASSTTDAQQLLWWIEKFKEKLIRGAFS